MDILKISTLVNQIRLSKPTVDTTLKALGDMENVMGNSLQELALCIKTFNSDNYDEVFINAQHTKSLINNKLPAIETTFTLLLTEKNIEERVLRHLLDSDYFKEVWEIGNPTHLMINILILLYRTTLLETDSRLMEGKAQISSTLEEMSLLLAMKGRVTGVYEATKHWISDWEGEGFSKELAMLQSKL